jgi:hypothetical protein
MLKRKIESKYYDLRQLTRVIIWDALAGLQMTQEDQLSCQAMAQKDFHAEHVICGTTRGIVGKKKTTKVMVCLVKKTTTS